MTFSQAYQDKFALKLNDSKKDGTYLELGTNHPITHNNTYLLESKYNWSGLLIEYDKSFESLYPKTRPKSKYIIGDARVLDYNKILEKTFSTRTIDYLQIDLDADNCSTLTSLLLLSEFVMPKYKFKTVTFEHDSYRGNFFNTRALSREIFKRHGYQLIFPDVSVMWQGSYKPFEDWYVYPELISKETLENITGHEKYVFGKSFTCDEINSLFLN